MTAVATLLSARRSSDGARRRSREERDRGGKGGAKGSKDGDLATSQPEAASSKMNVQQSAGGATPLDVVTNAGEETATALGKDNRRPQVPIVEPDEGDHVLLLLRQTKDEEMSSSLTDCRFSQNN
jgi:hypothetical protein